MKKLFFLSMLVIASTAKSQNTFPEPGPGNVGIGTLTPTTELEVIGTVKGEVGIFNNSLPNGSVFTSITDRNEKCLVFGTGTQFSPSGFILNILDFPESNYNNQAQSFLGMEDRNYTSRWRFYANTGGSSELLYYNKNQSPFYTLKEDGNDNVYLKLPKENSYLTIGTSSNSDNGDLYKLNVNGKVRAHSVKIYTDWADYVFDDDFLLPTLNEVEKYIQENGHLKDIPSAKEVKDNGIELGEMNKLLLQKIEELTLYTIQLKKDIDELKIKID